MNERHRHIFRIEGLSKEEISMRDLAAYLTDLAELLGHHESVHFQEVREGSVEVTYDVDLASLEPVTCRLLDACHQAGDPAARSAYLSLNQRLKRDRSSGIIMEQSETDLRPLVDIPGMLEETAERFPVLWEAGTADGTPTGVGRPTTGSRLGIGATRRFGKPAELRGEAANCHRDSPPLADGADTSPWKRAMGA